MNISGKKIAMVVPFRDFRDAEYFISANFLISCGGEVVNVSRQKGTAIGVDGGDIEIQMIPEEFRTEDFDALVFVGGPGTAKNLENQDLHKMASDFVKTGKVLAAICIAPVLLAKAGLLSGKKATVWSGPMDKTAIKILKEEGALYQEKDLVVDNNLVTANGPAAANKFAEALVKKLDKTV